MCNWAHPRDREGENSWLCWKTIAGVYTHLCLYIYMHPTSSLPSPHITQWTRHLHETPASISGTWSGWISLRLCQHRRPQPLIPPGCWCCRAQTDGQPSQRHNSLVHPFVWQQVKPPLLEKLETSEPSGAALISQGDLGLLQLHTSQIYHRRGNTSKARK